MTHNQGCIGFGYLTLLSARVTRQEGYELNGRATCVALTHYPGWRGLQDMVQRVTLNARMIPFAIGRLFARAGLGST